MNIEELVNSAYTSWAHDKGRSWTDHMAAALAEQAEAYEQRIRELEHELQNKQFEAQRVPEGWKLVPIEATQEMLKESGLYDDDTIEVNSAAPKKEGECVHRFMYFGDQPNRRCADCNAIEGATP